MSNIHKEEELLETLFAQRPNLPLSPDFRDKLMQKIEQHEVTRRKRTYLYDILAISLGIGMVISSLFFILWLYGITLSPLSPEQWDITLLYLKISIVVLFLLVGEQYLKTKMQHS